MIEIIRPGREATIQDLGRRGFGHLGVPRGGAADVASLLLGNRLVGNRECDAGIEFLLGNFALRFLASASFSLTGAPAPARLDRRPISYNEAIFARAGQTLSADQPVLGLRTYLAVAGGIAVPKVMGSKSTDTLGGVGPLPLTSGDTLPVGTVLSPPGTPSDTVVDTYSGLTELEVPFWWGPRYDWFEPLTRRQFISARWTVTPEFDRSGARLLGPRLAYNTEQHLATEGVLPGSVQVPPSGLPIVFLANHPPTGGYPVIGIVRDIGPLAQAAPGSVLRMSALPDSPSVT